MSELCETCGSASPWNCGHYDHAIDCDIGEDCSCAQVAAGDETLSDPTPPKRLPGMKITDASHLDHGLTEKHLTWLRERFAKSEGPFVETVQLPPDLPALVCALHGPAMGDLPVPESECVHQVRGQRPGPSRLCSRRPRFTRLVTVVAGPHDGHPCVLYTAYGGPIAPREVFDPALAAAPGIDIAASLLFWNEHALSKETT